VPRFLNRCVCVFMWCVMFEMWVWGVGVGAFPQGLPRLAPAPSAPSPAAPLCPAQAAGSGA
jgi:hypothetical protein